MIQGGLNEYQSARQPTGIKRGLVLTKVITPARQPERYAWINIMIGMSVRMPCRVCRERINHVRRLLLVLLIMISYYI
jgi:hypothetical protein